MSVKVEFKRVQTDAEVENIDIKDGQLIYTGTGKTFMDYGNQRIPTGSGAEPVEVDTEMSDTSENAVQNKVIKEYVDSQTVPEEVIISDTQPTGDDWKLWIDTGAVGSAVSEITNEYSTSIGLGYSANYVNNLNTYSETEQRIGTWIDGKPVYRRVIKSSFDTQTADDVRKNISTSGMNIKKIVEFNGFIDYTNQAPINSQNGYAAYFSTNNNIRVYNTISAYLNVDFYLIIYYTKTTD